MKLTRLFQQSDNSRELKPGEIKGILICTAARFLPDFKYLMYQKGYYFQRERSVLGMEVAEIICIQFSLKGHTMDCNMGSFLNRQKIFDQNYSSSLINPTECLKFYKNQTKTLPLEKSCYLHNGRVLGTERAVEEIFDDCRKYGLQFFDKQMQNLKSNPLVLRGLEYISHLKADKKQLQTELETELRQGDYNLGQIHHPVYIELKESLQHLQGIDRETRKRIPKLAYDLLELYAI